MALKQGSKPFKVSLPGTPYSIIRVHILYNVLNIEVNEELLSFRVIVPAISEHATCPEAKSLWMFY